MGTEDKLRAYLKRATVELAQTRQRLSEVEERRNEPVAIVGMACRFPGGGTVEDFWALLRDGGSPVREVPASRWNADDYYDPDPRAPGAMYTKSGTFLDDIAGWDAEFFGLSPREALRMDPHQRLLLELTWEGLENAGLAPSRLAGSRTGVTVGYMDTLQYGRLQIERQGRDALSDPYLGQGSVPSVAAGRIAYQFDLVGPTMTVDTACSSSLVAVHLAAESLRRGECDLAIAAGVSLSIHPSLYIQACAGLMMSRDGRCKTFDEGADGYVMGEGGGLVVLEPLSRAIANGRRIRAVLRGSAVNQDGRSNGLTAPSRRAQADVIGRALAAARVTPDDVDYVEAHGSGTHLGDAIELSALHDVFGGRPADRPLHVGAAKTNIGHTQAAAGIAGLIKTTLILETGLIPPTLNVSTPAVAIPEDGTVRPVTGATASAPDRRPRLAGVSSFGLSGTNAHLVLEAAPSREAGSEAVPPDAAASPNTPPNTSRDALPSAYVFPLSAASGAALREQAARLAAWLEDRPETDPADLAHTLRSGRSALDHRRAMVAADLGEAIRGLRDLAGGGSHRVKGRPRIAFLLPGVGDHYAGLGRDLYAREPVYAEAVDRCVEIVHRRSGRDLRPPFEADPAAPAGDPAPDPFAEMLGRGTPAGDDPLDHAVTAHPFLFTVEYALARLLAHRGVTPDLLIGYSLGEYVAACLAGVFTLEDALHVVVERAHLIAAAPAGRMVAAAGPLDAVRPALTGLEVDVAALNGPSMTVLSGTPDDVAAVTAALTERGIACRPLRSAHAFHSFLLRPAREKLAALLDAVPRRPPAVTIVSNLTGRPLTPEQATSVSYWADQLVGTVRFSDGVRHCLGQDVAAFVELGPGQTLGGLVRQNLTAASGAAVLGTLPPRHRARTSHASGTADELTRSCARLWELGTPVSWENTQPQGGRVLSLPTYPFQRTRFWPEPADPSARPEPFGGAATAAGTTGTTGTAGTGGAADHAYVPSWRQDPAPPAAPTAVSSSASLSVPPLTGPLVVFADPGGVGTALADLAEAAGVPVVEVVPGAARHREGRRLTVDPAAPGDYAEVFAGLGEGRVHVAHLWGLTPAAGDSADEHLAAAVTGGFDSLLLALQALGDLPASRGVRLLTVSRGAAEILGRDVPAPQQALVHGLGRAARHEIPGLVWSGVDLDPETGGDGAGEAAREVLREIGTDPEGDADRDALAAWRRGRRWTRGWAPLPVDAARPGEPVWRPDGAYLITGGTRGLGMALARHLVRSGVRRLALAGRTPIDRTGGAEPDERAARTLRDVAELEAAGAEVLLVTADVGDPAALREALRRARTHFGALHGVVHAAGLPAGGLLGRRTVAQAREVLAPKVLAMGPLAELVGPGTPPEERPELLVLYSSAVTAFGGIGEGDYCAANTLLDAYGQALAAAAPSTRVVSVAWGPWRHDVWQAENLKSAGGLAERVAAYRERYGFSDEAGCALLDRIAASGHGSVLAVRQPLHEVIRDWSGMLDLDSLVGAAAPRSERFPRPELRADYTAPRTPAEARMAELWGAYLGIDRVGVHDPFFDLGGNSLVGMAMVLVIEKELGRPVPPALLFERPTVAEFAAALDGGADGPDTGGEEALADGSARGQRRRRARVGRRG
ncbi:SDR family NAD(P)-dependent oxidoreductase [Microbispora sp. RL4-1S]|uniref:SDR family NAD(P)-dependent oxidoreductase n=1 Tax=Microbispora oryzae TaxID=2806554 RepID=A0A940WUS0_9ACTN|nr:type I polyketide synthase [Microbispora oryzae]MBP2707760.1 SDR family NAD(P)-dependent oxidoreductase [Microbispora oryzae]